MAVDYTQDVMRDFRPDELERAWLEREAEKYHNLSVEKRIQEFKLMLDVVAALGGVQPVRLPSNAPANLPWWPPPEPLRSPLNDELR